MPAAYASEPDVLDLTGSSVTAEDVERAEVIVLLAGGIPTTATLDAEDVENLRRAVCYQAAFMGYQPGLFGAIDVQRSNLDGHLLEHWEDRDTYAATLAPLARLALKRVSIADIPDVKATAGSARFPLPSQPPGDWRDRIWGGPVKFP